MHIELLLLILLRYHHRHLATTTTTAAAAATTATTISPQPSHFNYYCCEKNKQHNFKTCILAQLVFRSSNFNLFALDSLGCCDNRWTVFPNPDLMISGIKSLLIFLNT